MRSSFLIVIMMLLPASAIAQIDTVRLERQSYWYEPNWSSSVYVALGFGIPNGLSAELGYHFDKWVSLGLMLTRFDQYSDEGGSSFGAVLRLHAPIEESIIAPYMHLSAVGSSEPTAAASTTAGAMITLVDHLYLRPELGLAWVRTQKYPPEGYTGYYTSWDLWYTAGLTVEVAF